MTLRGTWIGFFLMLLGSSVDAQEDFYALDHVPEVHILFAEDNWDEILDAFFLADEGERLTCQVEVDGVLLEGVGIRYKGYSSASVDRDKNPFNIKINHSVDSLSYQGIDKIKLANVIQDPSFLREVLSYQIGRKYLPSCRANFAKVHINGVYWGLYTNVESVDKQFLADHYWTTDGAFFKCNPESLDLFGENSNLSDSPGDDPVAYATLYDMKSDSGYDELLQMIQVLHNDVDNVEEVLHIDQTLWMHAFNYALINFDSYVGYAQNYYLYQDHHGRFCPMLWDLNMSFASFRLTDCSEFYDGFSIAEAQTIDPLTHLNNVSVFPRPLLRKLLDDSTFKRMYLAHLRTIIEENVVNGWYVEQAEIHRDLIEPWVELDTNKFYSFDDFLINLEETVIDLVEYPGLTDLMEARSNYLMSYTGLDTPPDIQNVHLVGSHVFGENVVVEAEISASNDVRVFYRFSGDAVFESVVMESVGGDIYQVELTNVGNRMDYFVYAQNEDAGRFDPERAAYVFYSSTASLPADAVVLNEAMSDNATTVEDGSGDFDDWVELHNRTNTPVSTAGLFLSDDPGNLLKWPLPDHLIPAQGYTAIWADEDGESGHLHANFQLDGSGESLLLSDSTGGVWDETFLPMATTDVSWARYPNATGPFVMMSPTYNAPNEVVDVVYVRPPLASVFPNPVAHQVCFAWEESEPWVATLIDSQGRQVRLQRSVGSEGYMQLDDLQAGFYTLHIQRGSWSESHVLSHYKLP